MADRQGRWWGEYKVPLEAWARWQIGPLTLWGRPTNDEWRLAWHTGSDRLSDALTVEVPASGAPEDELESARFALSDPGEQLRLAPCLAERAVIVRPETALWIPPEQRSVLYVGTTAWISIEASAPNPARLMVLPVFRPSDSWFGQNTREGEVCFASRTKARTRLELLDYLPHRLITPVELINHGSDTLMVEQLRLPVTALSLYESGKELWTDAVRFTRERGSTEAEVDVLSRSELLPAARSELQKPAEALPHKTVLDTFSSFFS